MSLGLVTGKEANWWKEETTAQAFWDQYRALPYRELLRETIAWCDPQAGEKWLDLGCGSGHLTAALWQQGKGTLEKIVATDCAAVNARALEKVRFRMAPARPDQIEFQVVDFSPGLPQFADHSFNGVVSGLAISYAECFDDSSGCYTDAAYNRLYHEIHRILRPGGRFVFSVNVPNPNFWRIVWKSFGRGVRLGKPLRTLKNVLQMQRHGHWLKREAKRGRFHFLPQAQIAARLQAAGFNRWKTQLAYADQAFIIRADKD